MKKFLFFLLLVQPVHAADSDQQNWQAVSAPDPLSRQTACLMTSVVKYTDDGQTTTPVSLVFNGDLFVAVTESNIDLSYPDLGIQVDRNQRHAIDRLHQDTHAVFESGADRIRDEFIKGIRAKLTLGFWPTWPKTRSYTVEFSLRGFTRAYHEFQQCRKSGDLS